MSGAYVNFDAGPSDWSTRLGLVAHVSLPDGGERMQGLRLPGPRKVRENRVTPAEAAQALRALADWIEAQDAAPQHRSS